MRVLSLLLPAPRGAIGQMAGLGPYSCTAVLFTAWVDLGFDADQRPSAQPYFTEDGGEFWLFYRKQFFFSVEMIDVFKLTLLSCSNVGEKVPLPY